MNSLSVEDVLSRYVDRLKLVLDAVNTDNIKHLAETLLVVWREGRQVMICGNGGSAGNAIHLANDFLYGVGCGKVPGMKVEALPANSAVISCLANDEGYEYIFSEQIKAKGCPGDVLLVLSGSGNSPNVVNALNTAKERQLETFAILGFDGGQCLKLAKYPIHFPVNDMQVSEDTQLIVGHICMQWLSTRSAPFENR